MKSLSIKLKIALIVTSLSIGLIGIVTKLQLHYMRQDFARVLDDQLFTIASREAADIDSKLRLHMDVLARSAATMPHNLLGDPAQLRAYYSQSAILALFDDIIILGPDGQVLADVPEVQGRTRINAADRAYFQQTMATKKPVISAPVLGKLRKEPIITIAAPVMDGDGKIVAVLTGVIRLYKDNFLSGLRTTKVGKTGYFFMATKGDHPIYVIHPAAERIMQPRPSEATPEISAALAGGSFEGTVESVNSKNLHALFSYKSLKMTEWGLVAVLPTDEAFAPINAASRRLIAMAIGLALLVAPLIWAVTFRLLKPLTQLQQSIQQLRSAPHRFNALQVTQHDELGELAQAFNLLMQERMTAEARQRESEKRFHAAVDSSLDAFYLLDAERDVSGAVIDFRFHFVNANGENFIGLPSNQVVGQLLCELLPINRTGGFLEKYIHVLESGQPLDEEFELDTPQIRARWAQHQVVRVGDGIAISTRDITARREMESARRTLAAILEANTDFVAMTDSAGRVRYINPAGRRIRGIAPDADVNGTTIADYYPPWVLQLFHEQAIPAVLDKGSWLGESAVYNAAGQEIPVAHMILAHRTPDGKVEYFSGVMRDISHAKLAQNALQQSEARLRRIADALPMLIADIDTDLHLRFCNLAYQHYYGIAPEEVQGRALRQITGETAFDCFRPHALRALTGEIVIFERELALRDDYNCQEITFIPQAAGDGALVLGLHMIINDVTARKLEQRRLLQLTEIDGLTGLANRTGFNKKLKEAMENSRTNQSLLVLMYLDIDRFKQINDTHGHPVGDALLKAFSGRLAGALRSGDTIARLGGDEFTVIIERLAQQEDACAIADKIVKVMQQDFRLDFCAAGITTSIGVAFYQGGDISAEQLIKAADEMLYQAKGAGRNNYQAMPPMPLSSCV